MARGWESKSVELQMESALAHRPVGPVLTAEERERVRQRESLLLSRTRVLNEMEKTANDRYRAILAASLEFLDQKLKLLE